MAFNPFVIIKSLLIKEENTLSPKQIEIVPGGTANTKTTLVGSQTTNKTVTLPDAADTLATVTQVNTVQTNLDNHIADPTDAHDASAISNVPAGSIVATDVQAAVNELDSDIQGHISDATDAHMATAIGNTPAGTISATTVQSAVNELDSDIQGHINDATDAHDASAISVVPTGNLSATDAQAALVELQTQIDSVETTANAAANKTLSNLTAPTALNVDLLPDGNNTRNIGSSSLEFAEVSASVLASTSNLSVNTRDTVSTSGAVNLYSGNSSAADSGEVYIGTGTAATTRGEIILDGRQVNVSNTKIINVATPTANADAANKEYVDAVAAGLDPKQAVRVATTAPIGGSYATTPSNGRFTGAATTVDSVSLSVGDRVLIKDQVDQKQNGIYVYDGAGQFTRSPDMDGTPASEVSAGNYTFATQGTVNISSGFVLTGNGTLTLNTDNLVFTQFSGSGGASRTLDNLNSPTAINQSLLPDTNNARDLGSNSLRFKDAYFDGFVRTDNLRNVDQLQNINIDTEGGSTSAGITLQTGNATVGSSGSITVLSGNALSGTSGSINLTTSLTAGTRGDINLSSRQINVNSQKIVNLSDPTAAQDAATKAYVDANAGSGGTLDTFFTQTFDKAVLGDFTQVGLTLDTTAANLINGTVTARLIHDSAINQYFLQSIPVAQKYRGVNVTFSVFARSTATAGNVQIIFTDLTSFQTLLTRTLNVTTDPHAVENVISFDIPDSCQLLSYEVRALPQVGSPVTLIDDIRGYLTVPSTTTSNFIQNGQFELGVTNWSTYTSTINFTPSDVDTVNNRINLTTPGLAYDGLRVRFTSSGTLPAPLVAGTDYYVVETSSAQIKLATTPGGTAIDLTTQGTIGHVFRPSRPIQVVGASAGVTITTSTTTPLQGTQSGLITVAASSMGEGVKQDFTISRAAQGRVLGIKFDLTGVSGSYNNATATTDPSLCFFIYDNTNLRFIEPSKFRINGVQTNTYGDTYEGEFQSASNSTSYTLVYHTADEVAHSVRIDNISVSPNEYVFGSPISDWQEYTPTTQGFSALSNANFYWRRNGASLEVRGKFTTASGNNASEARIGFPAGLVSAGTSLIPTISYAGEWRRGANTLNTMTMLVEPSVTYFTMSSNNDSTNPLSKTSGNQMLLAGETGAFYATAPIAGWSSSVQMADSTSTRVVAANAFGTYTGGTAGNPIIFPSVRYDTHAAYNATTGRFTAPVSGFYRVATQLNMGSNGNLVSVHVDGVLQTGLGASSANTNGFMSGSGTVFANAGQLIDIRPTSNAGTASGSQNYLSIERISGPAQIASSETVAASYWASANQTINTQPINFDSREFDTHGAVTTGAGVWKFTAPISGIYQVCGAVDNNTGSINLYLYKNGVQYKYISWDGVAIQATFSTLIALNAGEYIDIRTPANVTFVGGTLALSPTNININRIGNRG